MIANAEKPRRVMGLIAFDPGRPSHTPAELARTLDRLGRCELLDGVLVLHAAGGRPAGLDGRAGVDWQEVCFDADAGFHARAMAGRHWSPTAWRGGLGGTSAFDEALYPQAMAQAVAASSASAVLLVGADWAWVDPALCDAVIEKHQLAPDNFRLTFSQAPPGLAGCCIEAGLIGEIAAGGVSIGQMLDYNPHRPQADPIGRDVCVQVPAAIRQARVRAIGDTPRWRRGLERIGMDADAETICAALRPEADLPAEVTIELTPCRPVGGPVTPQHHRPIERGPMSLELLERVVRQLGAAGDVAVTFGGLGDALEHPQWRRAVGLARAAGVRGVHLETDLHVDEATLDALLAAPIDVLSVRLNADVPETYDRLMGGESLETVRNRIGYLLEHRSAATRLPWIVPRMIKTTDNVEELESFVDRWLTFTGHAVVEPPLDAAGTAAALTAQAVIDMAPPRRVACRQLGRRMTIHADGRVALCDQDWTGEQTVGDANREPLSEAWARLQAIEQRQQGGCFDAPSLCAGCRQWHRP